MADKIKQYAEYLEKKIKTEKKNYEIEYHLVPKITTRTGRIEALMEARDRLYRLFPELRPQESRAPEGQLAKKLM